MIKLLSFTIWIAFITLLILNVFGVIDTSLIYFVLQAITLFIYHNAKVIIEILKAITNLND